MQRHYLDTSAIAPLFIQEERSSAVARWLSLQQDVVIVSDFASAEYASTVSRLFRMQKLDEQAAASALADFDQWRAASTIRRLTTPADIATCERLVRRFEFKLLAPDALHIAMALADDAALVTFDERQAEVMRQLGACVVPV